MVIDFFKSKKKYNNQTLFIEIEKELIKKNTYNYFYNSEQLEYEMKNYDKSNIISKDDHKIIIEEIFELLNNTSKFSKEEATIIKFLNLNEELLQNVHKNFCHISYTSQLFTNWILSSLNTNFMDKSYFNQNKIYFNIYDIINKFSYYYKMYIIFYKEDYNFLNKEKKEINHIIFNIINTLINKNIFEKKNIKIKIKKIKKNKNVLKTHTFLCLKNSNIKNNIINFNIFLYKPKIYFINNTYYLGGFHYSTFNKVFKTNSRSNESFKLKNKQLINKICSLKYKIDFSFYEKIYLLLCKHLNIDNDENSLNDYILKNLKEVYNKNLFNESENKKNEEEIENEKKIFQQEHSKLLIYYLFDQIKKNLNQIDEFYLSIDFDFRGRLYPKSCISPTGNKIFRFLYYYGYYSQEELKKIDLKNIDEVKKNLIKKCVLFKIYDKIDLDNNIHATYCYWCLFEIGKIFKNELSFKLKGVFNDLNMLEFSCEIIDSIINNNRTLSFEEELQYIYITSCLEDLNKGLYKKLIVYKDATASGIQILTVILGANNDETLKHCNLRSFNSWYDTYMYIINLFVNKYMYNLEFLAGNNYTDYIKRSDLKRSIMTYIYGAGKKTALNYYLENLSKKSDEEVGKKIFSMFYDFLDILFSSTDFFGTSSSTILDDAKKEYEKNKKINLKTTDKAVIPLVYHKIIFYRLDRIIEENRSTIVFTDKSDLFDEDKTYRSIIANVTQALDALFLRLILLELEQPIITIHDSFGIDILNIYKLIDVANKAINKIFFSFERDLNYDISNKVKLKIKINNFYSSYILM